MYDHCSVRTVSDTMFLRGQDKGGNEDEQRDALRLIHYVPDVLPSVPTSNDDQYALARN